MFDLKARREKLNISQQEVAKATGVSRGTVSKWESGDIANMKRDKIAKLAKLLHVSPLSIIGMPTSENTSDVSTHTYQYLDAGVACGAPELVESYTKNDLQHIQLSDAIMGRYAGDKDILIIHANGESMNRVFPNGALLAVKKTNDLSNGDIVVFSVDDEDFSCKRYYKDDKAKVVSFQPDSDDPKFEPFIYRYEDAADVTIFGKVIVYTVIL